jgi:hypothetical protein
MTILKNLKTLTIFPVLFSLALFAGCDENGGITIPSGATELTVSAISNKGLDNPPAVVVITEVKALIHTVQFEQETNQNNQTITFSPFVVHFSTNGSLSEMTTKYIIRDFYTKVKFQIHKPEDNETPSDPEFISGTQRYSFIIKGTYNGNSFTYKSASSENIVINFSKTENFELTKTNVTIAFNELGWFKNGSSDLDPNNPQNASMIDNNIRNSFKAAFLDNDKNGIPD